MGTNFSWQYDELKQVGVDYTDIKEVQTYDSQMQKLRDIQSEVETFVESVGLKHSDSVLEIGTGTGELALNLAARCSKVFAIDVSPVMLEFAQKKAADRGIANIEFYNGGFLTYNHHGSQIDVVVSQLALHHLPDFWKLIALKRICALLKEGGKFYLRDTVYSFEGDHRDFLEGWISGTKEIAGEAIAKDLEIAIRDEYSTYDWVMEGLLERAGFVIDKADYQQGFMAVYLCTKK